MLPFLRILIVIPLVLSLQLHVVYAHDVAEDIQADATDFPQRLARMRYLQQSKFGEGIRQRAAIKLERATLDATGVAPNEADRQIARRLLAFPFTAQPELKSSGTIKTLTVLVDFKDHRAATELPTLTRDVFDQNIYGSGTVTAQDFTPYESVHAYYERASERKVDLAGTVLDWHHFPKDRNEYQPKNAPAGPSQAQQQARLDNLAIFKIATEALDAHDAVHDFSQYDNDNDGDIDLLTILYAGPRGAWSSFWWAYRWEFFIADASSKKFDGKRLKQFVFQFVDTRGSGSTDFNPRTLMHEMGHAFGLADYYDYDKTVGPAGGVGGLDMMHGNWGNHCAFSRWLLDWIEPEIIGSGPPTTVALTASGSASSVGAKAVAIFPGLSNSTAPSQELFMIENRSQFGNDNGAAQTPSDGILVWHIDATVNPAGDDFVLDNSFTLRKLIRLLRAGSVADFGDSDRATASDYFNVGKQLSPISSPSSQGYNGPTNIVLSNISPAGEIMALDIGFQTSAIPMAAMMVAADGSSPKLRSAIFNSLGGAVLRLDRIRELDETLSTANPEELAAAWETVKRTVVPAEEQEQLQLVKQTIMMHWAAKDGRSAVVAFLDEDSGFNQGVFSKFMEAWANNDVASATEWYFAESQNAIRETGNLDAGTLFTKKAIEFTGQQDRALAIKSIDKLRRFSEIVGATEGLAKSANSQGIGGAELADDLNLLKENANAVRAITKLKASIEEFQSSIDSGGSLEKLRSILHDSME